MKNNQLIHALDHVLSDLDMEPWGDYKKDPEFVKQKIDNAIAQIKHVQDIVLKSGDSEVNVSKYLEELYHATFFMEEKEVNWKDLRQQYFEIQKVGS